NTCTNTNTVSVSVYARPSVAASASNVCADADLNLTSTPSNGTGTVNAYAWSGPASYVAATQNTTISAAQAAASGVYTVTVTDDNTCTNTNTVSVTVYARPSVAASASNVCADADLNLTSTPSNGTGTVNAYAWSGPASYAAATQNTTISAAQAAASGVYTVTVTDDNTCTNTNTVSVTVYDKPVNADTIICAAQAIEILPALCSDCLYSLNGTDFQDSATFTSASAGYSGFGASGTGAIYVISTVTGCENQATLIYPCASPLSADAIRLEASLRSGQVDLKWTVAADHKFTSFEIFRNDATSLLIGATTAQWNEQTYESKDLKPLAGANTYTVKGITADGSTIWSNISIVNTGADAELLLYPNPASNELSVTIPSLSKQNGTVTILDMQGRVIWQENIAIAVGSTTKTIPLHMLASGSYFITLSSAQLNMQKQFMKK
ncbi:MAG: hypothetical protein RL660_1899, partial [Bacteroidota bacterium]